QGQGPDDHVPDRRPQAARPGADVEPEPQLMRALLLLCLVACDPANPPPPPRYAPAPQATPVASKAPIRGLVDMQNIAWHNSDEGEPTFDLGYIKQFPGQFGGVVINATWRALQAKRNGPIDTSTIDKALDDVRAYNAANPSAP